MKNFQYGDEHIGYKEIFFGVSAMVIGQGILTLPRILTEKTESIDGWMCIALGGLLAIVSAWAIAKVSSYYPNQPFTDYVKVLVTKPIGIFLIVFFFIYSVGFVGFEVRALAEGTKLYLFDRTPVEVIALSFFLVIIYAVSGTRVALLRLNLMFTPIVLGVTFLILLMNLGFVERENFQPLFVSSWKSILNGTKDTAFSFLGGEILYFYVALMRNPKQAPKAALLGMIMPVLLYIIIFLSVVGLFGPEVTREIMYPTVEMAKEVEVPGAFLERFESLFNTVWIMTVFNTASMGYDLCLILITSLIRKGKRKTWIILLSPFIYLLGLIPKNMNQVAKALDYVGFMGIFISFILPFILLLVVALRKGKNYA
ncbi:MAG TPA: endospore germination permease [Bacillota bacterium]|nr:endospore germination permease [Bacillota bacterium]